MSNDINALRDHLFSALRGLNNGTVDVEKAKAISDVAQVIINSAKVEIDHIKVTGQGSSGFITDAPPAMTRTPTGTKHVNGGTTIHKLAG